MCIYTYSERGWRERGGMREGETEKEREKEYTNHFQNKIKNIFGLESWVHLDTEKNKKFLDDANKILLKAVYIAVYKGLKSTSYPEPKANKQKYVQNILKCDTKCK